MEKNSQKKLRHLERCKPLWTSVCQWRSQIFIENAALEMLWIHLNAMGHFLGTFVRYFVKSFCAWRTRDILILCRFFLFVTNRFQNDVVLQKNSKNVGEMFRRVHLTFCCARMCFIQCGFVSKKQRNGRIFSHFKIFPIATRSPRQRFFRGQCSWCYYQFFRVVFHPCMESIINFLIEDWTTFKYKCLKFEIRVSDIYCLLYCMHWYCFIL